MSGKSTLPCVCSHRKRAWTDSNSLQMGHYSRARDEYYDRHRLRSSSSSLDSRDEKRYRSRNHYRERDDRHDRYDSRRHYRRSRDRRFNEGGERSRSLDKRPSSSQIRSRSRSSRRMKSHRVDTDKLETSRAERVVKDADAGPSMSRKRAYSPRENERYHYHHHYQRNKRGDNRRSWRFDSPPRELVVNNRTALAGEDGQLMPSGLGFVESSSAGAWTVEGVRGHISGALGSAESVSSPSSVVANLLRLSATQRKATCEVAITNLPPGGLIEPHELLAYLNAQMISLGLLALPGSPFVRVWLAADAPFGFAETRSIEEATMALRLSNVAVFKGKALQVSRPRNYPTEHAALLACAASATEHGGSTATTGPQVAIIAARAAALSIGGGNLSKGSEERAERVALVDLPKSSDFSEEELKKLLISYGSLPVFQYFETKPDSEGHRESFCLFEYERPDSLRNLRFALEHRKFAGRQAKFLPADELLRTPRYAEVLRTAATGSERGRQLMRAQVASRTLMLSNMATRDELLDEATHVEIVDDIRLECSRFGLVLAVEVPRPLAVRASENKDSITTSGNISADVPTDASADGSAAEVAEPSGSTKEAPESDSESVVEQTDDSAVGYAFVEFDSLVSAGDVRKVSP